MCGVAGNIALSGELSPGDLKVVRALNEHQRRRGPDGDGFWASQDRLVALGHRRLAIIDVGDTGAQPMNDVTGRWTASFNGEIYNYRELRAELQALGRRFKTNSDTEVLINCVAEWGEAGLGRLRGMYAFALWDNDQKELWLARDPFGIKPLFYASAGAKLYFASQARALAECAPVNTSRNSAGLVGFFLWGYVPEPFSWWEGIQALPAGHLLRVRHGQQISSPKAFQRIEAAYTARPAEPISQDELKTALIDAISHHYVADVTVGVFLSAGVDSTVIAALAKEAGYKLKTVTLAFDEFKGTINDEAPLAEETARLLGADHQTLRVSREAFLGMYDDVMQTMDQPTTDGLNTYLVSRAASSVGLKVALSGLGGDELFGGYPSFWQVPQLAALGARIPGRNGLGNFLQGVGLPVAHMLGMSPKPAASLKYSGSIESAYYLRRCLHLPDELEMLLDDSWSKPGFERLAALLPNGDPRRASELKGLSPHGAVSQLEITNYMRNQPLRDTDWASMAHSLEVRVPFLDLPLMTKAGCAITSHRPPTKKQLAHVGGPVSERLIGRAKTGFNTPIATWLSEGRMKRRGLRPWADKVATMFRHVPSAQESLPNPASAS